jgi:hypothetical protein
VTTNGELNDERSEVRDNEREEDGDFSRDVMRFCCRCDFNDSRLILRFFCSETSLSNYRFVSLVAVTSPFMPKVGALSRRAFPPVVVSHLVN